MTCKLAATLCAALLLWAVVCKAVSPTEPSKEFRCQCTMFYAVPINPKIISELRLIERGPQCNSTEMLVKLVDERQFCLNPMKKWVQHLVYSYLKGFEVLMPQGTSQ